jgi:hypothetical protein
MTPQDFITKMSKVACVIQCGGLWFGGKGWGITWKLNQCVVKPQEVVSVYGKCHIELSSDDLSSMNKPVAAEAVDDDEEVIEPTVSSKNAVAVEDSDEEQEEEPEPVAVAPVKKVIKKAAEPVAVAPVAAEAEPVKKKVVKKKAV